ncbi:hypothetical protein TNCV_48401 [Trichonephila clavipes]|nr:hypothetical protein TNCV_48401 [Trichonephila clavipes]
MDFTEINSRAKRKESLGRIDRQNSRFRTAKTTIIKFGLHVSFVELESAKSALNELCLIGYDKRHYGYDKRHYGHDKRHYGYDKRHYGYDKRHYGYDKRRLKSLVYADNPQTLDHLEDNIRRVIADIRPQMLEKVIENWTSRLDYIRASRGSPMPEILFKM